MGLQGQQLRTLYDGDGCTRCTRLPQPGAQRSVDPHFRDPPLGFEIALAALCAERRRQKNEKKVSERTQERRDSSSETDSRDDRSDSV